MTLELKSRRLPGRTEQSDSSDLSCVKPIYSFGSNHHAFRGERSRTCGQGFVFVCGRYSAACLLRTPMFGLRGTNHEKGTNTPL